MRNCYWASRDLYVRAHDVFANAVDKYSFLICKRPHISASTRSETGNWDEIKDRKRSLWTCNNDKIAILVWIQAHSCHAFCYNSLIGFVLAFLRRTSSRLWGNGVSLSKRELLVGVSYVRYTLYLVLSLFWGSEDNFLGTYRSSLNSIGGIGVAGRSSVWLKALLGGTSTFCRLLLHSTLLVLTRFTLA